MDLSGNLHEHFGFARFRPGQREACEAALQGRESGGLMLFIATMPGASADSTWTPASEALRRRAVISTSGSSGTQPSLGSGR